MPVVDAYTTTESGGLERPPIVALGAMQPRHI